MNALREIEQAVLAEGREWTRRRLEEKLPQAAQALDQRICPARGSFKREAADRLIFFGEVHLRRVVGEYLSHYHCERNHQGLEGQIIEPGKEVGRADGKIRRRKRLGGMLNYYYRDAA